MDPVNSLYLMKGFSSDKSHSAFMTADSNESTLYSPGHDHIFMIESGNMNELEKPYKAPVPDSIARRETQLPYVLPVTQMRQYRSY